MDGKSANTTTAPTSNPKRKEYELLKGLHRYVNDSGDLITAKPGDKVPLTAGQAKAFANKMGPVIESSPAISHGG